MFPQGNSSGELKDFLTLGPLELMREAGQSYQQVQTLLRTVSLACAPTMVTALELRDRRSHTFFPTSLRGLDVVLHGGLAGGTLTEVTGPSGCGKSQFCMMLSVLATLPRTMGGLDSSVDTESAFCAERLGGLEEEIISKKAGLVIIDSIASVVRKEFDTSIPGNLSERSSLLSQEAATLKYLAEEFSIPVVLTNQITTHLRGKGTAPSHLECNVPEGKESPVSPDGESGYVTAALGNTWNHSVNTRLIVQYLDSQRRQIIVAKSPIAPFSVFNYTVQNSGLELEDGENQAGSSHQGTDPGLQPIRVRTAFNYCLTHTTPTSSHSTSVH